MARSDRLLIGAGGAALVLAVAAGWVLLAPQPGQGAEAGGDAALLLGATQGAVAASPSVAAPATIVVDVEGAVVEPGIRELPAGARVADALEAAGGYAADVDLQAAATSINLAEPLADGVQIVVPRMGAAGVAENPAATDTSEDGDAGGPDGPVNINTASAEELEALPGIGPVTVERIIEARATTPFASLDDALDRGVINRGQREDIEGLATAG